MEQTLSLAGQAAIVTGGGRGIGRAVALALAAAGSRVVVNDLGVSLEGEGSSTGPAEEVTGEIKAAGGEAVHCFESVATMDGGRKVVQACLGAFGRVDTLVCAAGILRPATIFDMTEEQWDSVLTTNLKGHFSVIQPAARLMRDQKSGTIVTFTSTGGLEGNPLQPNYSASKEGIVGLTRAVALSLAPYATCNAVSPSGATRLTDRMLPPERKGTAPDPSTIAPLIVFLASGAARQVTGQVIGMSGERATLYPQPRPFRTAIRAGGWTPEALAGAWTAQLGTDQLVRYDRYAGRDLDELARATAGES